MWMSTMDASQKTKEKSQVNENKIKLKKSLHNFFGFVISKKKIPFLKNDH